MQGVWTWSWEGFWPQLARVFLALGLKALRVRRAERGRRRREAQELEAVRDSLRQHAEILDALSDQLERRLGWQEMEDTLPTLAAKSPLDLGTWRALEARVVTRLEPELASGVADHFLRLEAWLWNWRKLVEASLDPGSAWPSAGWGLEEGLRGVRGRDPEYPKVLAQLTVCGLREQVKEDARDLAREARDLADRLAGAPADAATGRRRRGRR